MRVLRPLLGLLLLADGLLAQDPRRDGRLDAVARRDLDAVIAKAQADSLPVELLLSKTREGLERGAAAPRIISVVDSYRLALLAARAALGIASTTAELDAGAVALRAGVDSVTLSRIREHRAIGQAVHALVVLTDLMARGVDVELAARAVRTAVDADATDRSVRALRDVVASRVPVRNTHDATSEVERFLRTRGWAASPPET